MFENWKQDPWFGGTAGFSRVKVRLQVTRQLGTLFAAVLESALTGNEKKQTSSLLKT